MAQAKPVDQQEHEEYLEQRYGYSRIPKRTSQESNSRLVANTNQALANNRRNIERNFRSSQEGYVDNNIQPPKSANTNKKPRRRRIRRRSAVTKALHPASLMKRAVVWAINLFFFWWQIYLGIFFLITLGLGAAAASNSFTDTISDLIEWFSGVNPKYFFMLLWGLLWIIGWINMAIVWIFFMATGTHSLSGEFASNKQIRFKTAMVLYALPFLNVVPWVFAWSGFVLRNPK